MATKTLPETREQIDPLHEHFGCVAIKDANFENTWMMANPGTQDHNLRGGRWCSDADVVIAEGDEPGWKVLREQREVEIPEPVDPEVEE